MSKTSSPPAGRRKVYCVLSARSLPYARLAFESLFERNLESIDLCLVTDTREDALLLEECLQGIRIDGRHAARVIDSAALDDLAASRFAGFPHLQDFRAGHPCWRKITDPLLLADSGEEAIVLDPDTYFPNLGVNSLSGRNW